VFGVIRSQVPLIIPSIVLHCAMIGYPYILSITGASDSTVTADLGRNQPQTKRCLNLLLSDECLYLM
jgi:hypothetical protein